MSLRDIVNHLRLCRAGLVSGLFVIGEVIVIIAGLGLFAQAVQSDSPMRWNFLAVDVVVGVVLAALAVRGFRAIGMAKARAEGLAHRDEGRYAEAERCLRTALAEAEHYGAADPCRGEILLHLVAVARAQGNFDDAEHFGERAITAQSAAWGPDHARTAHAHEDMAETYRRLARYDQTRTHLEQAQRIWETHGPASARAWARCLKLLADLAAHQEQWSRAETFYRQALVALAQTRDNSSDALLIAADLSRVCVRLNKLEEAETLAETVTPIAEQDRDAPLRLATCLSRLALVRHTQGRHDEAEKLLRRAMDAVREVAPANPFALHEELHLLGIVQRHQGFWAEAEECFRTTLQLREEYLAPTDLAIARISEDYAQLLELMGRMEEAHKHEHHARQVRDFHSPFRIV